MEENDQLTLEELKKQFEDYRKNKSYNREPIPKHLWQAAADTIKVPHVILKEKEACPACGKGKLYIVEPGTIIRVTGNATLAAKVYELARLRCNLCGQVFTADAP